MASYLLPTEEKISFEEQRLIFSIRNGILYIFQYFPIKQLEEKYICGGIETMNHICSCKELNSDKETTKFHEIFSEKVAKQKNWKKEKK